MNTCTYESLFTVNICKQWREIVEPAGFLFRNGCSCPLCCCVFVLGLIFKFLYATLQSLIVSPQYRVKPVSLAVIIHSLHQTRWCGFDWLSIICLIYPTEILWDSDKMCERAFYKAQYKWKVLLLSSIQLHTVLGYYLLPLLF